MMWNRIIKFNVSPLNNHSKATVRAAFYLLSFLGNEDSLGLAASYAVSKKESLPEALYTILPDQYKLLEQSVRLVPRGFLRPACSEFIAGFEGDELEPERKMIERFHSVLNKRKRQKEADPLGLDLNQGGK